MLPRVPPLVLVLRKPGLVLFLLGPQPGDGALLLLAHAATGSLIVGWIAGGSFLLIAPAVFAEQQLGRVLQLGPLALEVRARGAALLGAVRRDLAAIAGEHLPADEAFVGTDHQDVAEQSCDLILHRGDQGRDGDENGDACRRPGP